MAPKKKDAKKDAKKAPGVDLAAAAGGKKPPPPRKPPPPPKCFNSEDIARFKEVFKEFDTDGIDKVKLADIPIMLRFLGFNPKNSEIADMFKKFLEDEFVDMVELHEWYFMIEYKKNLGDEVEAEVTKAMGFLGHDNEDEPTGTIKLDILAEELMNWGDVLTEPEYRDWPKVALKDKTLVFETGDFNYIKFIDNMNAKDVKFNPEPVNFFKMDQKTLAAMAMQKAMEEKAEMEKREAERAAREEARRQRMIEAGLIQV